MTEVQATGGWTPYRLRAAARTNATLLKASEGKIGGWYLYNNAAYAVFLKFYDTKTVPTAGAGTPVLTLGVPAGGAANCAFDVNGLEFQNGIGFTITKLLADSDTTVLVADDLIVNLAYV